MNQIQLEFLGAAGGVTGSRTLVRYDGISILIDCGLFQGPKEVREQNWSPLIQDNSQISAVILTHAHLDHSGYLPRFFHQGFRGPVYCSEGTADLCKLLLMDAAHLEEEQADFANATRYSHHFPAKPLFTRRDVEQILPLLKPFPRGDWNQVGENISFRFVQAGHIIGASLVQLSFATQNGTKILTFSGDLGHDRSLTMVPPNRIFETDFLVLESTYGDRLHTRNDVLEEFATIALRTIQRKGVLIIPAFAVGRAQEVLYIVHRLEELCKIPSVPVVLDSPMAEAANQVFMNHPSDHRLGDLRLTTDNFLPKQFRVTPTANDSMLACMEDGPMIVVSAAGMLNGGRVLHHLKHRLPNPLNTVLFCGFQAEGTKGRFLQDNAGKIESLRIHHTEVPIEAEIATIQSLSAHGDYLDLIRWFDSIERKPSRVFLNHGSPESMNSFSKKLSEKFLSVKFQCILSPQKILL